MTSLELIVRTAAATATLILAAALVRTRHANVGSRAFGALLCLGVVAYLACSGAPSLCSASPWLHPALLLAAAVPFFFWGWTTAVMDDEFRVRAPAIVGAFVLVISPVIGQYAGDPETRAAVVTVHSLLGLLFVIAALATVLRGWRQDLIEPRRRLRAIIVVLGGGYSMAVMIVELFLRARPPHEALLLVNALLLGALLLGLACSMLQVSSQVSVAFGWTGARIETEVQPAETAARDREQELIDRLNRLMTTDAAYRDADIAIPALAARLGVTEKKLRQAINGRLGFKNFSSFVNAFRVEEVRRRLDDPAQDAVPILTMALEAGFGSIAPFNRAFKDRFGAAPSAYRMRRDELSSRIERRA